MAYFDPYQVQAMVGFGQPQGMLSPEEEMATLGLTPGGQLAPTVPPAQIQPPMAGAGALGIPAPFEADPRMMGLASITDAFNALAGGGANAFRTGIAMQQQAYEMQNDRLRALKQAQIDNPFYEFETAIDRGYFKLNEGETADEGFLRYTRERFAPKSESVYSQKVSGLVEAGFDKGLANQLANGLVEIKEGPGGIQQIINKGTGEVVGTMTNDEAATAEQIVGRGKKFGENIQTTIDDRIAELDAIQDAKYEIEDLAQFSGEWLDRLSAKNEDGTYAFETGPLQGLMASLGLGSEGIGALSADDIFQRLQSLQIVNLAPVTQQEMKAMGELFANPSAINSQNIGKIKSFIAKLAREQKKLARKEGRARTWLTQNEDNLTSFDRQYLSEQYGDVNGSWQTVEVDY